MPKKWITVPFLNYYFSYTYTTIYYSILLIVMMLSFLLLELQCASKKSLSYFMKQRWVKLIHKRVSKHCEARIEQQEEIWISIAQFRNSILNTWDITINIKKTTNGSGCVQVRTVRRLQWDCFLRSCLWATKQQLFKSIYSVHKEAQRLFEIFHCYTTLLELKSMLP